MSTTGGTSPAVTPSKCRPMRQHKIATARAKRAPGPGGGRPGCSFWRCKKSGKTWSNMWNIHTFHTCKFRIWNWASSNLFNPKRVDHDSEMQHIHIDIWWHMYRQYTKNTNLGPCSCWWYQVRPNMANLCKSIMDQHSENNRWLTLDLCMAWIPNKAGQQKSTPTLACKSLAPNPSHFWCFSTSPAA